jgi:cyclopropane-fatty-acyl-phospholipid synthase
MWLLDKFLGRLIKRGRLVVTDADGTDYRYGDGDADFPDVAVRLTESGTARAIAGDPRLGAAEAYMDGRMRVERGEIRDLITLIRRNQQWEKAGRLAPRGMLKRARQATRQRLDHFNWRRRSKRNVAHHYDLSDELFRLFLDEDMQYSCAYFEDPEMSLEAAQRAKVVHILAKLALEPGSRVLDIGSGWGGMALAIHRVTGGEVLGITLSEEQLEAARRRAEEAGVADKVRFELADYRDVEGRFDRIVSVGMFEHVGPPNYNRFFRACHDLLAEDGVMLLHTIGRIGIPNGTDAFTSKYTFPGSYVPALSEIVPASEKAKLMATDIEMWRVHYAMTLDRWYDRTKAARDRIVELYDERFYRMWLFYLSGAGASFRYGGTCNYQIQYVRRRDAVPLTRDYLEREKTRLRAIL